MTRGQKIHEAEAHIAAIDRELVEINAALPHAQGPDRRQAWDALSVDAGPGTDPSCAAEARAASRAPRHLVFLRSTRVRARQTGPT